MMQTPTGSPKRKRLGEILIQKGRITPQQLTDLLEKQKASSHPLGELLVTEGVLDEEELLQILGAQQGIPHVWLRKGLVDPQIAPILPKEKAVLYKVVPMFRVNGTLTLAISDPHNIFVVDEVARITELTVQPVLCREEDIRDSIEEAYRADVSIEEVMESIDEADIEFIKAGPDRSVKELTELVEESPVINITNMILLKAVRDGASDIHIEPRPHKFQVRIRIDGLFYPLMEPKIEMHPAVVSRLKVMANLDIAERRIPQDGRFQVNVDGRTVDMRFSSMPSIHGEKVVLRVLDRSRAILDINKLGLDDEIIGTFKAMLRKPYGLILVCGPTGSGKTTSLYAAITMLESVEKNIVTIEDPVEYQLRRINQNQVNEGIGLTFAKFLKHTLRQDPDIVMVGEIRDRETAEIAIQASLTGHLVLSTLHTNDSPSAVTRMLEMGIEPYLIASALLGSMSQRLVRAICPKCRSGFFPPSETLAELGMDTDKNIRFFRGKGCPECYDSGFKGRFGLYELLEVDNALKALIIKNPTVDSLRAHLEENGFIAMREFGYRRVREGLTTLDEVQRVTAINV